MPHPPIHVLTFLESSTVTGPAKNLIEFATRARDTGAGQRPVLVEAAAWVRNGSGATNAYIDALEKAQIPVHIIQEKHLGDMGALRQLDQTIGRVQPDVIQSHNCKSHFFIRRSGRWRSVPWVAFHHGYTTTSVKTRIYNQFDRYSLRRTAKMVTVCQPFVRELSAFGVDPARISVVHNSVNEFVHPGRAVVEEMQHCHRIHPDRPIVLSVGRLSREKAHRDLVEAFAILRRRQPSARAQLVFVGDGHELASLKQQSSEFAGDVLFCGQQSDVRPFYAMANVFALPSLSEGSPNALLEAMAAGVPSVATSVGGVPEIATHGETALLVSAANPPALAESLQALLTDAGHAGALAARAKDHVLRHFSPETQTERLRQVYLSAVSTVRGGSDLSLRAAAHNRSSSDSSR